MIFKQKGTGFYCEHITGKMGYRHFYGLFQILLPIYGSFKKDTINQVYADIFKSGDLCIFNGGGRLLGSMDSF